MEQRSLIVVGYGNMGKAIVGGVLRAGVYGADQIVSVDPEPTPSGQLTLGTHFSSTRAWAERASVGDDDVVLLAVKPQVFSSIAPDLQRVRRTGHGPLWVSIMAGTTIASLESAIGGSPRVIRAMPNLPASVGQGVTAIRGGSHASITELECARTLFSSVGPMVVDLPEEQFDAFTAVAGSGPAYLFYLAEAMHQGALAAGLDPLITAQIVRQTVVGAAELLKTTQSASPEQLRAAVTSKGGTTHAACVLLGVRQVHQAFVDAIVAAKDRGRELAQS